MSNITPKKKVKMSLEKRENEQVHKFTNRMGQLNRRLITPCMHFMCPFKIPFVPRFLFQRHKTFFSPDFSTLFFQPVICAVLVEILTCHNGFNKPHLYTVLVSVRNSLTLFYMHVQNAVQHTDRMWAVFSLPFKKSGGKKIRAGRHDLITISPLSGMLLMRMEWRWGSQIIYLVDLIFPYQRTGPTWPEPAETNKVPTL